MIIDETVYFDGEEVKLDKPTKIIYKGFLCDSQPDSVYMHYGYGLLWENLQEIKLSKNINNNYESDITFNKNDLIFFCFRDSNGTWDNNYGKNFMVEPVINEFNPLFPVPSKLDLLYPKLKKNYWIRRKIRVTMYRAFSFVGKLLSGKLFRHDKLKG